MGHIDEMLVNKLEASSTKAGALNYKEKISLLTDAAALTSGAQTLALPAVSADNVGFTAKFTMIATAGQIFKLQTAASADKIITAEPDGDGTLTVNASADEFHFTAAADKGASFRVTMISSTAATAFVISDIVSGDATGTGEHVAA